jgi:hypothetical protein
MYNEARDTILQYGYDNVSLDILTDLPGLSHKVFSRSGQKQISKDITNLKEVAFLL